MKTQMKFQKLLLLCSLILAGISCFYALGFFTGSLASLYQYSATQQNDVINANGTFEFAQNVNKVLMFMGIAFVLVIVLMYITATQKRRNYYIDNYVTIGIAAVYAVVFALVALILIGQTSNMFFNEVDWTKYETEIAGTTSDFGINKKGVMFILGYILYSVIILDAAALVLNLVWKIKLMQGEKALLKGVTKEVA